MGRQPGVLGRRQGPGRPDVLSDEPGQRRARGYLLRGRTGAVWELVEQDGFQPAPYLARAYWVAAGKWGVMRDAEWQETLRASHEVIFEKLPRRTQAMLALPAREREKLQRERRKVLAAAGGTGMKKGRT